MNNKNYTALIILNYNNYEDTINCIESVLKFNTALIKFIIVDNASTRNKATIKLRMYIEDKSKNKCLHLNDEMLNYDEALTLPLFTYIESNINDGYACGNNKGLFLANRDKDIANVMVLNNDVLFVEDIIPKLEEWENVLADAALLSPMLYTRDLKEIDYTCARKNITYSRLVINMILIPLEKIFHFARKYADSRRILKHINDIPQLLEIELPSGSCMFIKKEKFEKMDFFDSNTFLYYEENILCKKVKKMNLRNYLISDLKCIHLGAQSTTFSNTKTSKYIQESQLYYFKEYCNINKFQEVLYKISFKWYNMWEKMNMIFFHRKRI